MKTTTSLALLMTGLITLGAACSDTDEGTAATAATVAVTDAPADTTATVATVEVANTVADTTTMTVDATAAAVTPATTADSATGGGPGGGGGAGSVDLSTVTSVDALVAMINNAYGDPGVGLQRGHQGWEDFYLDVLGTSHEEMHVRMDAGENVATVAEAVGVDPADLVTAMVEYWSSPITAMVEAGTITPEAGDQYLAALAEAFTFRINWNGSDDTPSFTAI
jgi:hypothetical protein